MDGRVFDYVSTFRLKFSIRFPVPVYIIISFQIKCCILE
nr:MAG TPA: hypothetical protein [Caudoviricetes sp.]